MAKGLRSQGHDFKPYLILTAAMVFGFFVAIITLRSAILTYVVMTRGSVVEASVIRLREGYGRPRLTQNSRYRWSSKAVFVLPDAPHRPFDYSLSDSLYDRLQDGTPLFVLYDPLIPNFVVLLENDESIARAFGAFLVGLIFFAVPAGAMIVMARSSG